MPVIKIASTFLLCAVVSGRTRSFTTSALKVGTNLVKAVTAVTPTSLANTSKAVKQVLNKATN
jgi:hypothetical protein